MQHENGTEERTFHIHSSNEIPWKLCKNAKRIVIKIGTRALVNDNRTFDTNFLENLASDIDTLKNLGKDIIIVSSGAVNAGVNELGIINRPKDLISLQAMAAVGNPILMNEYKKHITFVKIAQVLITQEDLSNRKSYNNFHNTLENLISRNIIPIINENDVVSVNELKQRKKNQLNFTDNDILAAVVGASINADLLLILTDVDGLYTKHPNSTFAEFIPYIPEITPEILRLGSGTGSQLSKGGMASKITAAQIMTYAGGTVILTHAKKTRVKNILKGIAKCTFFSPNQDLSLRNKEIWLMFASNIKGEIYIDTGAKNAIKKGASLLFNGIINITGNFRQFDIVEIHEVNQNQQTDEIKIARAKINFSAEELKRFGNFNKDKRKEYFKEQNIREIISHEHMVFLY